MEDQLYPTATQTIMKSITNIKCVHFIVGNIIEGCYGPSNFSPQYKPPMAGNFQS